MLTFGRATDADFAQIVALINAQTGGSTTVEQYTEMVRNRPTGRESERFVAHLPDGRFAGYACARGAARLEATLDEKQAEALTWAAHRGRGLGMAVKVAAVQLAHECGVPYISTFNHNINAPMVAINRQLGYQPTETLVQMHLPL